MNKEHVKPLSDTEGQKKSQGSEAPFSPWNSYKQLLSQALKFGDLKAAHTGVKTDNHNLIPSTHKSLPLFPFIGALN